MSVLEVAMIIFFLLMLSWIILVLRLHIRISNLKYKHRQEIKDFMKMRDSMRTTSASKEGIRHE